MFSSTHAPQTLERFSCQETFLSDFLPHKHARCSGDDIHQRTGLEAGAIEQIKYDESSEIQHRNTTHAPVFPSHKNPRRSQAHVR